MYVSGQPQLGFWKEALAAASKLVKQRKASIQTRAQEREAARQMKAQAKSVSPATAALGGMNPMLVAGGVGLGIWLLFKVVGGGRGRRR